MNTGGEDDLEPAEFGDFDNPRGSPPNPIGVSSTRASIPALCISLASAADLSRSSNSSPRRSGDRISKCSWTFVLPSSAGWMSPRTERITSFLFLSGTIYSIYCSDLATVLNAASTAILRTDCGSSSLVQGSPTRLAACCMKTSPSLAIRSGASLGGRHKRVDEISSGLIEVNASSTNGPL